MSSSARPWSKFSVGLVTIELETAFLVGAGDTDNLVDAVFVTDANGLPCIPGDSLAGVLRHALADGDDPDTHEDCCAAFGYQRAGEEEDNGRSSRVRISFAHVHDQHDRPVRFRGHSGADAVLDFLRAGAVRDHVRIGMHGAVHERGKFDNLVVPAGARFSFEISVSHQSPVPVESLVNLLARPDLRLGGKTRSGLGRFRVVRWRTATFDLADRKQLEALGKLPTCLHEMAQSPVLKPGADPVPLAASSRLHGEIVLKPLATWMIGGGMPTGREPKKFLKPGSDKSDTEWDRLPLTERRIRWSAQKAGDVGEVGPAAKAEFLVPGSSVKGALRHRTAFHARRLKGEWLRPGEQRDFTQWENDLFGEVRAGDGKGAPGRVFIADSYVRADSPYVTQQHVSLDRFTQGPMDHLLYDEIAVGAAEIRIPFSIDKGRDLDPQALQALDAALRDLCSGRLALGAGRGHGRFTGRIEGLPGGSLCEREVVCQ